MPKVSVIIVNYNGKRLIIDCLKTLGRQGFEDYEVVVVDNGSTDSSLYEIQRFLEEAPIGPLGS